MTYLDVFLLCMFQLCSSRFMPQNHFTRRCCLRWCEPLYLLLTEHPHSEGQHHLLIFRQIKNLKTCAWCHHAIQIKKIFLGFTPPDLLKSFCSKMSFACNFLHPDYVFSPQIWNKSLNEIWLFGCFGFVQFHEILDFYSRAIFSEHFQNISL